MVSCRGKGIVTIFREISLIKVAPRGVYIKDIALVLDKLFVWDGCFFASSRLIQTLFSCCEARRTGQMKEEA